MNSSAGGGGTWFMSPLLMPQHSTIHCDDIFISKLRKALFFQQFWVVKRGMYVVLINTFCLNNDGANLYASGLRCLVITASRACLLIMQNFWRALSIPEFICYSEKNFLSFFCLLRVERYGKMVFFRSRNMPKRHLLKIIIIVFHENGSH